MKDNIIKEINNHFNECREILFDDIFVDEMSEAEIEKRINESLDFLRQGVIDITVKALTQQEKP